MLNQPNKPKHPRRNPKPLFRIHRVEVDGITAIRTISQDLDSLSQHLDKVFVGKTFDSINSVKPKRPISSGRRTHRLKQRIQSHGGQPEFDKRTDSKPSDGGQSNTNRCAPSSGAYGVKPTMRPGVASNIAGIKFIKPIRSSSVFKRLPQLQPSQAKQPKGRKVRQRNKSIESLYRSNDSLDSSLRHSSSFYYAQ